MTVTPDLPDVYSARDIARAAGVRPADVRDLTAAGLIRPIGRFFSQADAVSAVRTLAGYAAAGDRALFRPSAGTRREPAMPLALAGALHAAILAALVMATLGAAKSAAVMPQDSNLRLVFLVAPGPGGGGGGGGLRQPAPAPPAERQGVAKMHSPVRVRRPPPRVEPPPRPRPVASPPAKADPLPPVVAPVIMVAADAQDRAGVAWVAKTPPVMADSRGPGAGGGAGAGQGAGLGEGGGAGIGPGSGGGTGGGPYRPGSGITAPAVLREVKPEYTEEGRRRNLAGDVVLEIVVRSDGSVGHVRLLQGLGGGLDQRAIEAVRQWRFSPARRYGTPVDVMVEVAMEFKLR